MQPPSTYAEEGFVPGTTLPAPWLNYQFNNHGAWIDYLRGPNVENWTRTAWATSPATFDASSPVLLAVDTTTVDTTGAARRYAIAGWETTGPTTSVMVSQRGNTWTRRTNIDAGVGKPLALACFSKTTSSRWVLSDDAGAIYYCAADDGTASGPVGSGSGDWSGASVPVSMPDVIAFASEVGGSAVAALVSGSDGTVYSTAANNGSVWTNSPAVTGGSRTGDVLDVCWDGAKFIYITDDGEVYASATAAGAFARQTALAAGAGAWRLAAGETGEVVAYQVGGSGTSPVYRSVNSGTTWTAITVVNGQTLWRISRMRYHDGTWIAVETQAPWIVTSSDLSNWQVARAPVSGSDLALKDIAWDGGAWVIAGNGWVLQCLRGADPSGADYIASATAATLSDAASLRGRRISSTDVPSDGDVVTWDAGLDQWVYGTPSGSLPSGGSNGYVLGYASGVPTWRSPSQARGDIGAGTGNGDVASSTLTTRGDIFTRGAAAIGRLALGAAKRILSSDGTDVVYQTIAALLTDIGNTRGDVLRRGSSGWEALGLGAARRVLASDGVDLGYSTISSILDDISTSTGRMLRRGSGAGAWEAFDAKTADTFVGGDGTDVTTRTAAQVLASLNTQSTTDFTAGSSGWTLSAGDSGRGSATQSGAGLTFAVTAGTSVTQDASFGGFHAPTATRSLSSVGGARGLLAQILFAAPTAVDNRVSLFFRDAARNYAFGVQLKGSTNDVEFLTTSPSTAAFTGYSSFSLAGVRGLALAIEGGMVIAYCTTVATPAESDWRFVGSAALALTALKGLTLDTVEITHPTYATTVVTSSVVVSSATVRARL